MEEPLPKVDLTPELLYNLLLAEVAGQRGYLEESATLYLDAARTTRDPRLAERAARIALFSRDLEKALVAARLWVEMVPRSSSALQLYAQLLVQNGQYDAAAPYLDRLTEVSSAPPLERYMRVAMIMGSASDADAALDFMNGFVDRHGRKPEALFAYASLALRADRSQQALAAVDEILTQRPQWDEAMILRARILYGQGQGDQALAYLGSMVERYPNEGQLRLTYARLLMDAKQLEPAAVQLERLTDEKEDSEEVLFTLGLLYLELQDYGKARKRLERLVDSGARVAEASYFLGQVAEAEERYGEADKWYAHVEGGRYQLDAEIRRALLLAEQGDVEGARQRLQALPAPDRETAVRIALAEGEVLAERERWQDALETYNTALAQFPEDSDLLYARALLYEKVGDLARTEADLRRIIEREPNNAQALNALGYTLADRTDRYREALVYIEKALALEPSDPFILDSMGWVQYKLGNYDRALEYLRRAFDLSADPEVAAHLGEVLWVTGAQQAARDLWDQALSKDPESSVLRAVIRRFSP